MDNVNVEFGEWWGIVSALSDGRSLLSQSLVEVTLMIELTPHMRMHAVL
jgi:hypothetical protein